MNFKIDYSGSIEEQEGHEGRRSRKDDDGIDLHDDNSAPSSANQRMTCSSPTQPASEAEHAVFVRGAGFSVRRQGPDLITAPVDGCGDGGEAVGVLAGQRLAGLRGEQGLVDEVFLAFAKEGQCPGSGAPFGVWVWGGFGGRCGCGLQHHRRVFVVNGRGLPLHRHVRPTIDLADVVHDDDVRLREPARLAGLPQEACVVFGVIAQ
jgi:hypothetical protein